MILALDADRPDAPCTGFLSTAVQLDLCRAAVGARHYAWFGQ
jgi:hypothetical protein